MASKLETLQQKMAKLQAQILEAEASEMQDQAIKALGETFRDAISECIAQVEANTGKSLSSHGLGVWAGHPKDGKLAVSILAVGEDGLPKALKRNGNGNGNGNGKAKAKADTDTNGKANNGNGWEYVVHGQAYATTFEALDALGHPKEDRGEYYHRWDRLPKGLQAKVVRQAKGTLDGTANDTGAAEADTGAADTGAAEADTGAAEADTGA